MGKELILKEIAKQNIHWKTGFFHDVKKYQRKLFAEILRYLPEKQMLSVVGLRRTGKTTIINQLINHLLRQEKINPLNILFISFDEALITPKLSLSNYLDEYLNLVDKTDKQIYIFLDEIQYVKKWQHILKRYYDTRKNLKFIVSGSSSLFIQRKTTESLAGRIYEFKLNHLSFEEYLELKMVDEKLLKNYRKYAVPDLNNLKFDDDDCQLFLARYGKELEKLFEDYLFYYQFPETIEQTDKQKIYKYITEAIYKKSIEYDIPRLFDVNKVDELKFIFQILINETGNEIEFTKMSGEAGVELNTFKKYLGYFHESLLFNLVYNYSKSFRKSKRLQKKGYIASTNFFSVFHPELFELKILSNQYAGKLVETYAYNALKEKFRYISFYKKGKNEIDFVCSNEYLDKSQAKLIEVKYVNNLKNENFSFLEKTAGKIFKTKKYFILSKNIFYRDDKKIIIPSYLLK